MKVSTLFFSCIAICLVSEVLKAFLSIVMSVVSGVLVVLEGWVLAFT